MLHWMFSYNQRAHSSQLNTCMGSLSKYASVVFCGVTDVLYIIVKYERRTGRIYRPFTLYKYADCQSLLHISWGLELRVQMLPPSNIKDTNER